MKIDSNFCINQNHVLLNKNSKSNISFGEEDTGIKIVSRSDKYAKVDIFDKRYKFQLVDEAKNPKVLDSMIENIKKTMTGYFIRSNRHEYYVPYILHETPKIRYHQNIVKNGNTKTEINKESKAALEVIQALANEKFDIKELKTIKYLKKTFGGYANNTVLKAFGYFDECNNNLYLYLPQNKKVKILLNNVFFKTIKL